MQAAVIVNAEAGLLAMAGRMDEAREAYGWARSTFRELALPLWLYASGTIGPSGSELRAGDPSRAEEMLVEGIEGLERISAAGHRGCVNDSSSWSKPSYGCGRLADAEAGIARLEELTRSHTSTRETTGSSRFAVRWRCCVEMRPQRSISSAAALERTGTGWLPFRGDVHRLLAEALREDGRGPEAQVVAREALEIYRTKGDVVSAGRVEAFLERSDAEQPDVPRSGARAAVVPLECSNVLWAIGETTGFVVASRTSSVRMGLPERHRCASRRDIVGTNGWAIPLVEQAEVSRRGTHRDFA